jgi:hypothetical protein
MKIKNRADDASMLQLDDWLAELREDGPAEAPGDDRPEPPPGPVSLARPEAPAEPDYGPAEPDYGPAEPPAGPTARAVIGDQLRMPVMWCEMGSCVSWHADPAALGERDMRARAIGAGWRIDALGRLVCPRCQQTDPNFRTCHQVVPWDRHTAMARAARIVAGRGEPTAVTRWHPGADKRGH